MTRILMYCNQEAFDHKDDSTRYIYEGIKDHYDTHLSFVPDPSKAKDADVVFCRSEIPVDKPFHQALAQYDDKLFINHPQAKIDLESKSYLCDLMETGVVPPFMVSSCAEEVREMGQEYGKLVLKPLTLNKGIGISMVDGQASDAYERIQEQMDTYGSLIVQQFLDDVYTAGERRINVVGYEPVSVIQKHAKEGSFLCNEYQGASAHVAQVSDIDKELIGRIRPFLEQHGVLWAGVDAIADNLVEVNVASPGWLSDADRLNGNQVGLEAMIKVIEGHDDYRHPYTPR